MDVFLEYLMRKEPSKGDTLKKAGLTFAAVLACVLVIIGFPLLASFLQNYVLIGVAAVVYGLSVLLRNFNLEYEYIFTNGALDVDVIKAKRTRNRLISLQTKQIQRMAPAEDERYTREFESPQISKRYDAVFNPAKGGIYNVLFVFDGEKMLLSFQPPVKLLAAMQKMNPLAVVLAESDKEEIAEIG